jgi:glycosyltransferase involved in cell wall biosynthesis
MKFSVITVNYNDAKGLENTINSVVQQEYPYIEYIIIDGQSTDTSVALIEAYKSQITYWISEPDNGIYDAMNKGINKATGDYLIFMNAGDTFYKSSVLSDVAQVAPDEDFVYGDAMLQFIDGRKKRKRHLSELNLIHCLKETITHQAIFHKRTLFENQRYNLDYKLIADWVFYTEQVAFYEKKGRYLDVIIANFQTNGSSNNGPLIEAERARFIQSRFSEAFYQLYKAFLGEYQRHKQLRAYPIVRQMFRLKKLFS